MQIKQKVNKIRKERAASVQHTAINLYDFCAMPRQVNPTLVKSEKYMSLFPP